MSPHVGTFRVKFGERRPINIPSKWHVGRSRPNNGRNEAKLGRHRQIWAKAVQHRPELADIAPDAARTGCLQSGAPSLRFQKYPGVDSWQL